MGIKPITRTLAMLQQGAFVDNCSDLMANIVRNVRDTGKPGKLTITLEVKKVNAAVSVLPRVTDKVPEQAPDADLFYTTEEGDLTTENPKQREQGVRVVEGDASKRDVRMADSATGEIRAAS